MYIIYIVAEKHACGRWRAYLPVRCLARHAAARLPVRLSQLTSRSSRALTTEGLSTPVLNLFSFGEAEVRATRKSASSCSRRMRAWRRVDLSTSLAEGGVVGESFLDASGSTRYCLCRRLVGPSACPSLRQVDLRECGLRGVGVVGKRASSEMCAARVEGESSSLWFLRSRLSFLHRLVSGSSERGGSAGRALFDGIGQVLLTGNAPLAVFGASRSIRLT